MIVYLSGPISLIPHGNYAAFYAAERRLRRLGHDVRNPREQGDDQATWETNMRAALALMLDSDEVAMLDGWEASRGARLEHFIALELGMDVKPLRAWLT